MMGTVSGQAAEPIAIIAGNGLLPFSVARAARDGGYDPFIVQLSGEGEHDWSEFQSMEASIGAFAPVVASLNARRIKKVVLSGGVTARPELLSLRPTMRVLTSFPAIWRTVRSGGDDAVLRMVIGLFEREGFQIVGAQDIAGDLVVTAGPMGRLRADQGLRKDIEAAAHAALTVGRMDIGQGAVSVDGRVVAIEGAEGTDQMLQRVIWMREAGRISKHRPGVLVKLCKPQQDTRADLPSIGPETVRAAAAAGLSGIAVEAGRSLILNRPEAIAEADEAGLFIMGLGSEVLEPLH